MDEKQNYSFWRTDIRQMTEYLIGECKFQGRPFGYSEYLDILAKLSPQKEGAKFFYALFSESGFDNQICEAAQSEEGMYLYSLDAIVGCRK